VAIFQNRLPSGSNQWTKWSMLSQRKNYSNQNPVIFFDSETGIVHLFHTTQYQSVNCDEGSANVWELQSKDFGYKWSSPKLVIPTKGSYIRNRMILGRKEDNSTFWILPSYRTPGGKWVNHYSTISTSNNRGKTWDTRDWPGGKALVQPSIVRLRNNTLKAFFRDRNKRNIYWSISKDEGSTWTNPLRTILPSNDVGIQACVLQSGAIAMVYNNRTKGRTPLVISLSDDDGDTWPFRRMLEPDNGYNGTFNTEVVLGMNKTRYIEHSYPTLLQDPKGDIHISYTYNRQTIKYVRVTEEWIRLGNCKIHC